MKQLLTFTTVYLIGSILVMAIMAAAGFDFTFPNPALDGGNDSRNDYYGIFGTLQAVNTIASIMISYGMEKE